MRSLVALALLALAGCASADSEASTNASSEGEMPELGVLTSLPIFFAEQFSVEPVASPLRSALEEQYQLTLLSNSSATELAGQRLVFMPHPPVQTAEALVDLDEWVRAGGRLLLIADQKVDWPSELPLGDLNRPPPFFLDTGLLAHWGVLLVEPDDGGHGRFAYQGEACSAAPAIAGVEDEALAYCRIGEGHVLILPDVDALADSAADAAWRERLPAQLHWLASR